MAQPDRVQPPTTALGEVKGKGKAGRADVRQGGLFGGDES
jgi:hypothetical protein